MSLKFAIDKEGFDSLDDSVKGFYTESGNGYKLQIEGLEDPEKLKNKNKIEAEHRKNAEKALADLQSEMETLKNNKHKQDGNYEALEKSFNEKLEKAQNAFSEQEKSLRSEIDSRDSVINRTFKTGKAEALAAELALDGSADVLMPHIEKRLSVERLESGDYKTVVLDEKGKPSALTIDELKESIRDNKSFAPIVKGSQATGSGAAGQNNKHSRSGTTQIKTTSDRVAARKAARAAQ